MVGEVGVEVFDDLDDVVGFGVVVVGGDCYLVYFDVVFEFVCEIGYYYYGVV